ncbi:hypothetical protein TNCV_5129911 [Trichonephila clavipes]|nr:hypothetical protein TNCV_5129911 [Trichonephila clavipes]
MTNVESKRSSITTLERTDMLFQLPWPKISSDFIPIENTWKPERLDHHRSSVSTIDETCHNLKQYGIICLYLPTKPNSTRCLTESEPL